MDGDFLASRELYQSHNGKLLTQSSVIAPFFSGLLMNHLFLLFVSTESKHWSLLSYCKFS